MRIITHSGKFHADEVFAVATLLSAHPEEKDVEIVRTRDPEVIKTGDFVVDVGGIYDQDRNLFDHHQPEGAGKRENGIPYSSFGIVWKAFGEKVCLSKAVADMIDRELVLPIDALDNGVEIVRSIITNVHEYSIGAVINAFTPSWKEEIEIDKQFSEALKIAQAILGREIIKTQDEIEGEKLAEEAYEAATDKRVIVMDMYVPWSGVLNKYPEPLFAVYPGIDKKDWHVQAVRDDMFGYKNRKSFPVEWAGKRDEELVNFSGVSDAVFCHRNLFLAVVKSKIGAIALAKIATES